ncbi:phospholipase D family protein [Oryzomonas rubra]|uniref:phospholipase D n=1 Tax=Oryzomonas rubra TaxID=2509454 RepID=A0A5A9XM59_9BACT|nr:phospholipase D family protein [Oryzomonas rubra]KAA0894217.1 phospholipase D family protein [Oryzomonas rubra]
MSRIVILFFAILFAATSIAAPLPSTGTVEVFFSPHGGATEAAVNEIRDAHQEILVQAYSFTSKPIAKALLDARKRGVKIEAVLDKSNATARYSAATFLVNVGIPVLIDSDHAIAHNKIIIIDRSTLITGSFNFTSAAEGKNAENLLVIKGNKPLVAKYLQNFETHKAHSTPYTR